MFKTRIIAAIICLLVSVQLFAQKAGVQMLATGAPPKASFRGMSIPTDDIIWVSGSEGAVGKSTDAGKSWIWFTVKGFENKEFRDIHAFDSNSAVIMAVGDPAFILKTTDGGKNWKTVFTKSLPGMFLDAMDFRNDKEGVCIGDPLAIGNSGRKFFYIIKTIDGGETWEQEPLYKMPPAEMNGEALFSASGTNIVMLNNHPEFDYIFATGGTVSNIYFIGKEGKKNKGYQTSINQGVETAGVFSIAYDGKKSIYCIGGDYKVPHSTYDNLVWTKIGSEKWSSPSVAPPFGYRSCIQFITEDKLVACGTNGVDIGKSGGNDWISVTKEGFNVCMVSPKKKLVFLAGDKGKIGQLKY